MHTLRTRRNGWQRRGVTLPEILVGIAVCLLSFWLFSASVVNRRTYCGRRMECQNNLKQIALAALNYAAAYQGGLPDLTRRHGEPGTAGDLAYPWVIDLLPYIDQRQRRQASLGRDAHTERTTCRGACGLELSVTAAD